MSTIEVHDRPLTMFDAQVFLRPHLEIREGSSTSKLDIYVGQSRREVTNVLRYQCLVPVIFFPILILSEYDGIFL